MRCNWARKVRSGASPPNKARAAGKPSANTKCGRHCCSSSCALHSGTAALAPGCPGAHSGASITSARWGRPRLCSMACSNLPASPARGASIWAHSATINHAGRCPGAGAPNKGSAGANKALPAPCASLVCASCASTGCTGVPTDTGARATAATAGAEAGAGDGEGTDDCARTASGAEVTGERLAGTADAAGEGSHRVSPISCNSARWRASRFKAIGSDS